METSLWLGSASETMDGQTTNCSWWDGMGYNRRRAVWKVQEPSLSWWNSQERLQLRLGVLRRALICDKHRRSNVPLEAIHQHQSAQTRPQADSTRTIER